MALCNVICSLCFGKSFAYDDPDFQHLLKMADKFFHYLSSASAVNFFPILWYLPFKANKAVEEGYDGIFKFVKRLVRECQSSAGDKQLAFINLAIKGENGAKSTAAADDSNGFPSVQTSTKIQGAETNHKNCERNICSDEGSVGPSTNGSDIDEECESVTYVATDLFIGGAETTHAGVMWALAFMIEYPDAQAQVQREIDEVVGNQRLPTWEDRHNLPYIQVNIMYYMWTCFNYHTV